MVITSLVANNVYGYLNFNINFNKDISFLVGSNGSGKTTALKLVNALVTPNFKELLETPFDDAYLFLEQEGEHVMTWPQKLSATPEHFAKVLSHVLPRTQY